MLYKVIILFQKKTDISYIIPCIPKIFLGLEGLFAPIFHFVRAYIGAMTPCDCLFAFIKITRGVLTRQKGGLAAHTRGQEVAKELRYSSGLDLRLVNKILRSSLSLSQNFSSPIFFEIAPDT